MIQAYFNLKIHRLMGVKLHDLPKQMLMLLPLLLLLHVFATLAITRPQSSLKRYAIKWLKFATPCCSQLAPQN